MNQTSKKLSRNINKYSYLFVLLAIGGVIYLATFLSNSKFLNFLSSAKVGAIEATRTSYDKKLAALMYLPDINEDGIVDPDITGYTGYVDVINNKVYGIKVTDLKKKILDQINYGVKYFTDATKYHGYSNANAKASIQYKIDSDKIFEYYTIPPKGKKVAGNVYNPNYKEMLEKINICNLVDDKGISEIWIFTQDKSGIKPLQSNMYSKNIGDISDSNDKEDLPKCNKTYFVYNFNITKGLDEMIEIKARHLSKLLSKWSGGLYSSDYESACGTVLRPVNESSDGKYSSTTSKNTDCEDFKPDRKGNKKDISCSVWNNAFYKNSQCKNDNGFAYHIWWMQNLPGYDNFLYDGTKKVRNWWDYIGDIDNVYDKKGYLFLASDEFDPNATLPSENGPSMKITSPTGGKVKFPFTIKWDKIDLALDYTIKIDDLEHNQLAYNKTFKNTQNSLEIKLNNLKDYKRLENNDKIRVTVTAKTLPYGNLSAAKEFNVKDVEPEKEPTPTPTPKSTPTPKPTPKPTKKPTTTKTTPTPIKITPTPIKSTPSPGFPKPVTTKGSDVIPFPSGVDTPEPITNKPNNPAQIVFPLSVNLPSADVNFTWTFGTNAKSYQLIAGKTSDSNEYGPKDSEGKPIIIENSLDNYQIKGLPTDGSDVYVGIKTNYTNGGSYINSKLFKSSGEPTNGEPAEEDDLDNINTDVEEDQTDEIVDDSDTQPEVQAKTGFWQWLLKILNKITFGLIKAE